DADRPQREVEIVGVVGDVKHLSLDSGPTTDVYVPYHQIPGARMTWATNNMYLILRTLASPLSFASGVRRELQAADRDVPAANTRTMEQYLAASVAPRRFNVFILSIFAATALLLAATGLYSVISYSVRQRTHEIGLRMALGAQRYDVVRLVVGQALGLVLVGEVAGMMAALSVTRVMSGMLFGIGYADPLTFAVSPLVLAVVAVVASYIPARRAAAADPLAALRSQ